MTIYEKIAYALASGHDVGCLMSYEVILASIKDMSENELLGITKESFNNVVEHCKKDGIPVPASFESWLVEAKELYDKKHKDLH